MAPGLESAPKSAFGHLLARSAGYLRRSVLVAMETSLEAQNAVLRPKYLPRIFPLVIPGCMGLGQNWQQTHVKIMVFPTCRFCDRYAAVFHPPPPHRPRHHCPPAHDKTSSSYKHKSWESIYGSLFWASSGAT